MKTVTGIGSRPSSEVSADSRPSSRLLGRRPWAMCRRSVTAAAELVDRPVEQVIDVDSAVGQVPLRDPKVHAQGDQPLLGAVVQVAFEPAPFHVGRLQQPGPAGFDVVQRAGQS